MISLLNIEITVLWEVTSCTCSFVDKYLHFGGHYVAQLIAALRYKSEGCGFDYCGFTGIFH